MEQTGWFIGLLKIGLKFSSAVLIMAINSFQAGRLGKSQSPLEKSGKV